MILATIGHDQNAVNDEATPLDDIWVFE